MPPEAQIPGPENVNWRARTRIPPIAIAFEDDGRPDELLHAIPSQEFAEFASRQAQAGGGPDIESVGFDERKKEKDPLTAVPKWPEAFDSDFCTGREPTKEPELRKKEEETRAKVVAAKILEGMLTRETVAEAENAFGLGRGRIQAMRRELIERVAERVQEIRETLRQKAERLQLPQKIADRKTVTSPMRRQFIEQDLNEYLRARADAMAEIRKTVLGFIKKLA